MDSVRWSDDPEAMISGLARVAQAHGMPLERGAPVSWMMAHPPTMDRLRAIGRAGKVSDSRMAEILEESQREPADHYQEDQTALVPEDAAFSPAIRQRLQTRLTLFTLVAPIILGVPAVWLLKRMGLEWRAVVTLGSLFSMLVMYLCFEWIVGSVRETVKRRAIARHGQGVFAGFSPSSEPRLFDGGYHYDLGLLRFVDGALVFAGDRAHFTLNRGMTRRVWLGDGPSHWTPRKVVYIECQPSPEAAPVIFSLQSFEARFWPWTVTMAKRLHRQVDQWHKAGSPVAEPPTTCALPRVEGSPDTALSFRTAFRSIGIYCGAAFFLASLGASFDGSGMLGYLSELLCPMAVCGALTLFMLWPRLRWNCFKGLTGSPSRAQADS